MQILEPAVQVYDWGSATAIPELLGRPTDGSPVAEAWYGAHASASSWLDGTSGDSLHHAISADPVGTLGEDVVSRFGGGLPFLLKLIAAARPLSLQVHPSVELAEDGYAREDAAGIPHDHPHRSYRDRNHKPELVYALSTFEALVGFRAPRRTAEILRGLRHPVARHLHKTIMATPTTTGMHDAFASLVSGATRPTPAEVTQFADELRARAVAGSPSPRTDGAVARLERAYPGDPGAVTAVLLNPVTLRPGEALFVPAGAVHCYLDGVAVEIMANSDNVLRAGLTSKHVDIPELLRAVDCVAAPPIRIAPEHVYDATDVFYAPVDDFELSVTHVPVREQCRLPGVGPRVLLCLEGRVRLRAESGAELELVAGSAGFVPAGDGALCATGGGRLVQAAVP